MEVIKIGVSSRALFDCETEHNIYIKKGIKAYADYNLKHENEVFKPGVAFRIVKNMLALNKYEDIQVNIVLMSRACPEIATRMLNSLNYYDLQVEQAFFTGGASLGPYVRCLNLDLYLSANEEDVKDVLNNGIAAGYVKPVRKDYNTESTDLRLAFDLDQVLFDEESDKVFEELGVDGFLQYEKEKENELMGAGPFKNFIVKMGKLQAKFGMVVDNPIKIAICTARNYKVHIRCLKTLQSWGIRVSQAFFLNGDNKALALEAFNPDIFFDDSAKNVANVEQVAPSVQVIK